MDPYETPASALTAIPPAQPDKPATPKLVRNAVILLVVESIMEIFETIVVLIQKIAPRSLPLISVLSLVVTVALLACLAFFMYRGLLRGSKWAHRLYFILWAVNLTMIGKYITYYGSLPLMWEKAMYLLRWILAPTATVMLLLPTSWRWFYKKMPV